MDSLKQKIGNDELEQLGRLWTIVSKYPSVEELESLWNLKESKVQEGHFRKTEFSLQFNITTDEWLAHSGTRFYNWLQDKLQELSLPYQLENLKEVWCNEQYENGYQATHRHGTETFNPDGGLVSCVIYLDNIPLPPGNETNGCLYTFIPAPSGFQFYEEIPSERGKVVAMDSEVWHGAYQTDRYRRCIVVDIFYKKLKN